MSKTCPENVCALCYHDKSEAANCTRPDCECSSATPCSALANDVARCDGVGSDDPDEGWREGCESCLRRTASRPEVYLVMEPPIPQEAYIYPILVAIGMVGIEGWVLTRRKNKRQGKS